MPAIRGNPADKWVRRAGVAGQDYSEGVSNPREDWQRATTAAAGNWGAGVTQAIQGKRFEKGVAKAGTGKWQRKSQEVGSARFGPGVQAAQNDYAEAVAPYLQTIQSTQLPARGPKGSPQNINRVAVLAKALHDRKMAG